MNRFFVLQLSIFIIITSAIHLQKNDKSLFKLKSIHCDDKFIFMPRLPGLSNGLSLDVSETQSDGNGVPKYSKLSIGNSYHSWCRIGNKFISNENDLYLNVHGNGYICPIRDGCQWAVEIDGYHEGSSGSREWEVVSVVPNLIYNLRNLNGSLTTVEGYSSLNLAFTNFSDPRQQWFMHRT